VSRRSPEAYGDLKVEDFQLDETLETRPLKEVQSSDSLKIEPEDKV